MSDRAGPSPARAATGQTGQVTTEGTEPVVCSAKGCREPAAFALVWNNPRLHTPDREKVWTACAAHREQLAHHLAARSFLRRVDPVPAAG